MVRVRFTDPANLAACADFLRFTFPGDVRRRGTHELELEFTRGTFDATTERKIVNRLFWAWRTDDPAQTDDAIIVAVEQPQHLSPG